MATTISISRDSGYADRIRDYRVVLDGKEIGRLANADTKSFDVAPGEHDLVLKIDWCGSETVSFVIAKDERLDFRCGSNLRGIRLLFASFYVLFARHKYLWLKQADI